jgi:hypothetical protein
MLAVRRTWCRRTLSRRLPRGPARANTRPGGYTVGVALQAGEHAMKVRVCAMPRVNKHQTGPARDCTRPRAAVWMLRWKLMSTR